ncbi:MULTISPECIES: biotin-independent malonate decarboxylase subunit beta [Clostridium]|uniref:biotin-independent malonate decarboxylase subunit beta n=1 Tax=Clostridium TaxID=1485 RepID=UPI000826F01A|nr:MULTISPECIES: biotin-independent malonate decarboxylase subunit beta [Clostridium]PJI06870.1 malonate decarboxylase subunit beta [Clostridium sp. CT7]
MNKLKNSFIELNSRERAKEVLDKGTFKELIDPFEKFESPHLPLQDIVPQSDDGMVIAKGFIDGKRAVVISMEGAFQGGGIGEVSGAKFAGALELALKDNQNGIKTYPVVLFDTGGVRLQEANYGLLAISEIQAAVVALRHFVPVIGVIPGKIGCFGGMSMTAGLFSTLIMTPEGRLTLNGPEVIEQEAGIAEFDSSDKRLIWNTIGGIQRHAAGFADILVEDDVDSIVNAIKISLCKKEATKFRSEQIDTYLARLSKIDPSKPITPTEIRKLWNEESFDKKEIAEQKPCIEKVMSRGRIWFEALTGKDGTKKGYAPSILCADKVLGDETARFISVVPNPNARFPRARHGEVGLEEGFTIAKYIREAIKEDENKVIKRPIIAVVDVPSQAYGYKEELLGIFESCAASVDAYVSARLSGHPVISLIVGPAISGAFLAHGYQANKLIAFDDPKVLIHAMSKESAARVTKRSIHELEESAKKVPSIAYDIGSYSTLGSLYELVKGINADTPSKDDIEKVNSILIDAVKSAKSNTTSLGNRLKSEKAAVGRACSIKVRKRLKEEWN